MNTMTDAQPMIRKPPPSGDEFAQLMRRYNRTLFRAARSILRDDAEAEDAVQDAYLRAYRSIGTFRGEAKLSTWLVRIVVNEALARRRKQARRAEIVPIRDGDPEDYEVQAGSREPEGPEAMAERRQLQSLLEAKIDALSDPLRTVFMLRAVEELSVAETAQALGLPEATVRTRFFRARNHLRDALAGKADLPFGAAFAFAGERCARVVARVLSALLLAASVAACGEKPQLLAPESEPSAERLERDGQLRERTLNQGGL